MTQSWKLTLPCTRGEAEALTSDFEALAMLDPTPAIITREPDEKRPDVWELNAYFEGKPDARSVALLQSMLPSASSAKPQLEALPDEDWVTVSQAGLEPVHAGRFYIHTASNKRRVPRGATAFRIEASQAFGTGGHATTANCLSMLDAMRHRGMRAIDIADIGTGTGVLAFAAHTLWPQARIIASDIDPKSVAIARENAAINAVPTGQLPGRVALVTASGADHPAILARAPFDLIIANILAGPLIELAPAFAALTRPGASVIVAGLLQSQAATVAGAYRRSGFRLAETRGDGEWPSFRFVRRPDFSHRRPVRNSLRTSQPPGDFGTW
jgi:ribosomal protein L11 methyltransferase